MGLRQQRLRVVHESIQLHRDTGKQRQALWDLQVTLGEKVTTPQLRQAVLDAGLKLQPTQAAPETPATAPAAADDDDANGTDPAQTLAADAPEPHR